MANYDDEELHEAAFFFAAAAVRRITWQHLQHLSVSQGLSVSHSVSEQCTPPFYLPLCPCLPGIVWLRRRCLSVYLSVLATAYTAC